MNDGRGPPRAYVHLPFGLNPVKYRLGFDAGIEPDKTPYGFHRAAECGFDLSYSDDDFRPRSCRMGKISRRLIGIDLPHALFNRRRMADADVIWTMTEWDAMAARLLMALRIVPYKPIIGTAIWVVDWWPTLKKRRQFLYRYLLRRVALLLTHTKPCLDACRERLPSVNSQLMHFGIAAENFAAPDDVGEPAVIRIVAAGNDRTRDWQVLIDAFGNQPGVELLLINRELPDDLLDKYSNLTIPRSPPLAEWRRLYASATYIAVPMRDNIYSGITVALEAMAMGIPVISSRTGGVPTYMAEDEALFVPPGDPAAWRAAATSQTPGERRAMAERAQARFRRDDYSTLGMMRRYARFTAPLLGREEKNGRIDG